MILLGGILATVGMIGGAYLAIFLQERKESRLEQARSKASGSEIPSSHAEGSKVSAQAGGLR